MYKLCSICSRTYDYILKYERLAMETQQFLKYLKWDHIIPPTVIDFNLEWVKEWWQVSHFVCNYCDYSPYYSSRWHQLAWNFNRYFLFQKLAPFSSLILTSSIRILKILNIKHKFLVKYPQNISICGEYSQAYTSIF